MTDTLIWNAKPKQNKQYKIFDERGLFLLVTTTGSKGWRFRYRFAGREKLISLGIYPDVSLKMAGEKRDAARRLLAEDPPVDPSARRQAAKRADADTFEAVAREWMDKAEQSISKDTVHLLRRPIRRYVKHYCHARTWRGAIALHDDHNLPTMRASANFPGLLATSRRLPMVSQPSPRTTATSTMKRKRTGNDTGPRRFCGWSGYGG